ncbi:Uncharacterized protein C11E3.10 [Taphrina deformans PYCC 5710]|uniref:Uncharacterized protein C11E3.10 n=1 Tax=Taphrina deformans (strain PYCC 5710 / ATCC 11124 / CBS 356.35 / IMI 108563 / JCM 9778 / NBRC 8474) TaxID=1097556 RepID=R4X7G3_TAPDE|nr:Uncharacterized protein C11E3.10 [Taphrina deformans PYCC 5710]|eukprot:CCG81304.1 Uncharacterized protein C11E3.10 [Taphrina deformans PYCC 5710]
MMDALQNVHIRKIPAAIFIVSSLAGLYLGIIAASGTLPIDDKLQHLVCYFFMGLSLYWTFDMSKRRAIQFTGAILVVSSILSEFVQSFLTARIFDPVDIVANLLGSGISIFINVSYHTRMLRRRREAKYSSLGLTDLEEQTVIEVPQTDAQGDNTDGIPTAGELK